MNLEQAVLLKKKYLHLEGTTYDEHEISVIEIIPNVSGGVAKIAQAIHWDQDLNPIWKNYHDFEVIAFLDFDDFANSGYLLYETLDKILKHDN